MTVETSPSSPTSNLAGNILIVDDRPDIIQVLQLALEEEPARIYAASNGTEALEALEERSYDLILLDAKMPDISGPEICRRVKTHEQWRHTKVIMISASNIADDKLRAFDAGADDYVTKPFRVQELRARVQVMLNLRKAERELTHRNEQLLELIRVSTNLNAQRDLEGISELLAKSATRLTISNQSYVILWNSQDSYHYYVAAENPYIPFEQLKTIRVAAGQGISALVQETGKVQIVKDYPNFGQSVVSGDALNFCEAAGVPLRVKGRYLGTLVVTLTEPDKHFDPANIEILTTLTNLGASAIENARLYADLTREGERYRMIAEKASDLIISLDTAGTITYVNERIRALLGYKPPEVINKPFVHFLTNEAKIIFEQILHEMLREAATKEDGFGGVSREIVAISRQGVPVDLEFNFGIFYQPGGQGVSGLQGIGRDVTARKRSEEAERMRMVGQIASGVAHDLNNVLANVLGHAQLLKDEVTPEQAETIAIIEQSARDGAETVRRIQEFTVQRMAQNTEALDLNSVVQSAIDLSRPRWRDDSQQKGMRIVVERESADIPPVRGRAAELREVLVNLINNSIDAMPSTGGKIKFRAHLEENGQRVCLEIADNGKGMPPEVRRQIFYPFFTTKGVRGTGLGLSVAYSIITRFGGEISVDSTPNVGTTFYIKLPVVLKSEHPHTARKISPARQIPHYEGRVLAVDDEVNLRTVMQRALALAGFTVEIAEGGLQALEKLVDASRHTANHEKPFDIVFSDLGMPGMSGWELAQEISRRWPEMPIVLVTGWGDQLDAAKVAEFNIATTISKPFDISKLIEVAAHYTQNKI